MDEDTTFYNSFKNDLVIWLKYKYWLLLLFSLFAVSGSLTIAIFYIISGGDTLIFVSWLAVIIIAVWGISKIVYNRLGIEEYGRFQCAIVAEMWVLLIWLFSMITFEAKQVMLFVGLMSLMGTVCILLLMRPRLFKR